MPVIQGPYTSWTIHATDSVTADRTTFVASASGRRLVGFSAQANLAGGGAGAIHLGDTIEATREIVAFNCGSGGREAANLWPGVDASGGLSIDHVSGQFDITLYTIDVIEG